MDARAPHDTLSLGDVQEEIIVLLGTLAQVGSKDEHAARIAFEAGMSSVLPMRAMTEEEGELLRTVCALLHVPLPVQESTYLRSEALEVDQE